MMEQYFDIKERYADCLIFFRLGDFYEMFFDDAVTASKELDITLTGRSCGQEERAPMCGVPYHSADGYIARLIEKGYKIAICEQTEDPKASTGLVKREVIRVVTSGTTLDPNILVENKNNYIACVCENARGVGLAYADVSTGEFFTTAFASDESGVLDELVKLSPKEIIVNDGFSGESAVETALNVKPYVFDETAFKTDQAYIKLCNHLGVLNLNGIGLEDKPLCVNASGALLEYLTRTQKNSLEHILAVKYYDRLMFMAVDSASARSLELLETIRSRSVKGSLLGVLDRTKTAMGARLLRRWIKYPLTNVSDISRRLGAVEMYKSEALAREEMRDALSEVKDFERVMSKIAYKTANGRDLIGLKRSFRRLPEIGIIMRSLRGDLCDEMSAAFDDLSDIYSLIDSSICDEPPNGIREGGVFKDGYNEHLDKLRAAKRDGARWLVEMEKREKEKSGARHLKIRFNKVFGYYIEISHSQAKLAPEHYILRQTLSNCQRFTTPELKEIEETILGADERAAAMEFDMFAALTERIASHTPRIQFTAYSLAVIDVLQSLADVADRNAYVKPCVNANGVINIKGGRHPVVEASAKETFVPNDAFLDDQNISIVITGPNMSGKSTFMRQTALIALMAQMGSFVPASEAEIGVVDKIFTRVGASDDLSTGQSTFMVEMSEVAAILNNATKSSLIILDEIGRGTSAYDGMAIAWAVLEYITTEIGAKTLFSTHYHELTKLEGKVNGIANFQVMVKENDDDVVFLRKIVKGGAQNSYGVHVAKLAGTPKQVLDRANDILDSLSASRPLDAPPPRPPQRKNPIAAELLKLDIDSFSPRQALQKLYELRESAKKLG
jgi:DNA mismatch repair protein MutS